MIKVEFKDRSEQIEIAGKVYSINVSNYDFIKKAQANLKELESVKSTDLDEMLNSLHTLIDFILDGDFDRIWEACKHDVYALLDIANALAVVINKGFEYKAQKYV